MKNSILIQTDEGIQRYIDFLKKIAEKNFAENLTLLS